MSAQRSTPMSWHLRNMCRNDTVQAARIEELVFAQPWRARDFEDTLESPYAHYLVAEIREEKVASEKKLSEASEEASKKKPLTQIIAHCGYLRSFEEAEILNVAVHPAYQRRGIAKAMLKELMRQGREDGIERFTLEVRQSNACAIALYQHLGFRVEGIRKKFYSLPTEDALIMWTGE